MIAYRPDGSCGCAVWRPSVSGNPHIESACGNSVCHCHLDAKPPVRQRVPQAPLLFRRSVRLHSLLYSFQCAAKPRVLRQGGSEMLGPPVANPVAEHAIGKTVIPSDRRPRCPIGRLLSPSHIECLIELSDPSAIGRRVPRVRVYPINRKPGSVAIGSRPRHERLKFKPFWMYVDASSAVVFKASGAWVAASPFHCGPDFVEGRCRLAVLGAPLFSKASARNLPPAPEFEPLKCALIAARTATKPQRTTLAMVAVLSQDGKATKRLSGHVFEARVRHTHTLYAAMRSTVGGYPNVTQKKLVKETT